jgi:hypothetical protein
VPAHITKRASAVAARHTPQRNAHQVLQEEAPGGAQAGPAARRQTLQLAQRLVREVDMDNDGRCAGVSVFVFVLVLVFVSVSLLCTWRRC